MLEDVIERKKAVLMRCEMDDSRLSQKKRWPLVSNVSV